MADQENKKKQSTIEDDTDGEKVAERGKSAIEAGKKSGSNPAPDANKQGKHEEKDAEDWRNEG